MEPSTQPSELIDLNVLRELETVTLYHGETYSLHQMVRRALHLKNIDPIGRIDFSSKKSLIDLTHTQAPKYMDAEEFETSLVLGYVDQYFTCIHSTFPFLMENSVRQTMKSMAAGEPQTPASLIILCLVLAIGAVVPCSTSFVDISYSSRYFLNAIEVEFPFGETLETAQILTLFTLYSLLDSSAGNSWHLVDLTMQTCILLGLHQSQTTNNTNDFTNEDLAQRAGVFWSAYTLDRLVLCFIKQ